MLIRDVSKIIFYASHVYHSRWDVPILSSKLTWCGCVTSEVNRFQGEKIHYTSFEDKPERGRIGFCLAKTTQIIDTFLWAKVNGAATCLYCTQRNTNEWNQLLPKPMDCIYLVLSWLETTTTVLWTHWWARKSTLNPLTLLQSLFWRHFMWKCHWWSLCASRIRIDVLLQTVGDTACFVSSVRT